MIPFKPCDKVKSKQISHHFIVLDFNAITDFLYVGTCPQNATDVQQLGNFSIDVVLNLQSDQDLDRLGIQWQQLAQLYDEVAIEHCRLPLTDFDENDISNLLPYAVSQLAAFLSAQKKTYLHCTAGRERSPTVAAGWLAIHGGLSLSDSIEHVRTARHTNPYEDMLKALVKN